MTNTILTDEQIESALISAGYVRADFKLTPQALANSRAIEQAVLQSPEIQALYDLLKESRQQLPLAAQFWSEDDELERGRRNVRHVLELIARVDAAMEKQP